MSNGGQQPAGQTTVTQAPPSYMGPYIGTALGQAGNLLQGPGPQYYPGQTVADFSQPQEQAFGGIQNFAGNLLQNGGGSNPYEDAMFNRAAQGTQNQLASEFAGAGRNVGASLPNRSQQLNDLATQFYGGQYQNNINNAFHAGDAMLGVGNQIQQQTQNEINANRQKYDYYQHLPQTMLSQYEQNLSGVQPGSQTSNPYFTNPTADALGTGLAGLSLYKGIYGSNSGSGSKGGG